MGLLYPRVCQICRTESVRQEEGYVCERCRTKWGGGIRWIEPPVCYRCGQPYPGMITVPFRCWGCRDLDLRFSRARAAVLATDLILEVLHRYKYNRAVWFEPFLRSLWLSRVVPAAEEEQWDGIVPVPLHPVRERERGFNQAERLADWLSQETGIPVYRDAVRRVRYTPSQTQLSRQERIRNVRGAFGPGRRIDQVQGKRILVVDDVLTTGSTCSACAEVLRKAGAADVDVWTLARSRGAR